MSKRRNQLKRRDFFIIIGRAEIQSQKNYTLPRKKETMKAVAAAKEMEGKYIADQLEWNKSEALNYLFGTVKQSKNNN